MIGLAMLAAGGSRRFGSPKQLAMYEGESLLRRASRTAAAFRGPAIVVLGAGTDQVAGEVACVRIVINRNWREGFATSIHAAVHAMANVEALIIALADQPLVTAPDLEALAAVHRGTRAPAVAAAYGDTIGAPALFHRSLFPELLALRGDHGAKTVLVRHDAIAIPMRHARWDVDTAQDLERMARA